MRHLSRILSVSAAALFLAACQPQQGAAPGAGSAEPAPVATVARAPAASVPLPASDTEVGEGVKLEVVPAAVHACAGRDVVAAKIRWWVVRPDVDSVQVFVAQDGGERKLFVHSAASGEADTGQWLAARSVIELVDPKTGDSLGKHTMSVLPCD